MRSKPGPDEVAGGDGRLAVKLHLQAIAAKLAALPPSDIAAVRVLLQGIATDASLARGVTTAPAREAPVSATWFIPPDADPQRRIVYCHGLSFMAGDLPTYGGFVSRLASAARASTLFVDYRLAPEHHFPAAHDDCIVALLWTSNHGPDESTPATCAVIGDSAGASLAVSAALASHRQGKPTSSIVLFAPFVDLAVTGESWTRNAGRDPLLSADVARAGPALYAPGVDTRDLRLSPLHDDLAKLPPLQVHASLSDPLFDDAFRLTSRADRAGAKAELHAWGDLAHTWYLFHDKLPEARQAVELAGSFVSRK